MVAALRKLGAIGVERDPSGLRSFIPAAGHQGVCGRRHTSEDCLG